MSEKNYTPLESALIAIQTGSPILLWGEPGIGKTDQLMDFAKSVDRHLEVVLASLRDPTDLLGLPIVNTEDKSVCYAPPDWAMRLVKAKKSVLFLDEVNTAPRAVQAALLRVVLDRVVGDCQLPKETWIMAAANPPELSAGGQDLPAAFSNRFCHFDVEADLSSWRDWLLGINRVNAIPKLPEDWENHISYFKGLVSAYSSARPSCIQACPKNQRHMKAWPSLRSWTTGARLLAAAKSLGHEIDSGLSITLLTSAIGQSAAVEFVSYIKNLDLPNPEALLQSPRDWNPTKRSDITFAILTSVVAAYASNATEDRWVAAWEVIDHVVENKLIDVAEAAAHSLAKLGKPEFRNPRIILKFRSVFAAINS